jgi:hypothetical protein
MKARGIVFLHEVRQTLLACLDPSGRRLGRLSEIAFATVFFERHVNPRYGWHLSAPAPGFYADGAVRWLPSSNNSLLSASDIRANVPPGLARDQQTDRPHPIGSLPSN